MDLKSGHSEFHILHFISKNDLYVLLNNIRKNFVVIFEHPERVGPIVKEPNLSRLPTQRAGKCCCDVTGRVSKS